MKKIFILVFLVACNTNTESDIIQTTSTSSTTSSTSSSTSTSTIPEVISEKIYATELSIGDCFDNLDGEGYYFSPDYYVTRVPCDKLHSYEIISTINYSSNDDTIFGEDGVPNLEIYPACEKSYSEIFERDIGGTSHTLLGLVISRILRKMMITCV